MGIITREILSLADEEIQLPTETLIMPLDTLDFNFDFDLSWACDMFTNNSPTFPLDSILVY